MFRPAVRRVLSLALALLLVAGCRPGWRGDERDFRRDMREFVTAISEYGRAQAGGFLVIPQNGHELLTGNPTGSPAESYIDSIDGVGREDLFFGQGGVDVATPQAERDRMLSFMDLAAANGLTVLVTDYCVTAAKVDDSYARNHLRGFLSFAAPSRELDVIPSYPAPVYAENDANVTELGDARNFLYLLSPNSATWSTAAEYLEALDSTSYDVLILDLFFEDDAGAVGELSATDLAELKSKPRGGERLLVCYLSIGEAESYRYYWEPSWSSASPSWLAEENPDWPGNYKVEYWDPDWQAIIYGSPDAYLDRILAAGFDGVYLDIIDAYEYFEAALGI